MDNTREKLIELLKSGGVRDFPFNAVLADHLIANGVTVQEWISVDERKPDLIPIGAGTEYSEVVNVLTDGRKVLTAIWNGLYWICDDGFWDAEFEEITHWTPVLLPLPQPPKFATDNNVGDKMTPAAKDTNVPIKWIPVTERLPDNQLDGINATFLIVVKSKYPFDKDYSYDTDVAFYRDDGKGRLDGCWDALNDWGDGEDYLHVTHWMPLPEPPKGD